ncbi:MAG: MBL fold metallo-hydrolase [Thermoprotei archaeon]
MDAKIEEIFNGVYLVDPYLFDSEGYISLYFITQPKRVLFDVGPSATVERVMQAIERLGYTGDKIDYVIVSHVHVEHSGGLSKIAAWASNAKLIVSPASVRHLTDPSKMYQSYASSFGKFASLIGDYQPLPHDAIPRVVSTLTELPLGDKKGRIIQFVGHAHHQICLEVDGTLFGADILSTQLRINDQFLPTSTPQSFNYTKYTEDLDAALALNLNRLLISHYGACDNPTDIITRALSSLRWLRYQVESLLKEGLLAEEVADTLLKGLRSTPPLNDEYARVKAKLNLLGFINAVIKLRSEKL